MGKYNPSTVEEWNEAAAQVLTNLDVDDPQPGQSGTIPVNTGESEVLNVDLQRDTSAPLRMFNSGPYVDEITGAVAQGGPQCALPCPLLEAMGMQCSDTEERWEEPTIEPNIFPTYVPEATIYLNPFDASIEGDIRTWYKNKSEEGTHSTRTTYKCQENEDWTTEVVEGSADVVASEASDIIVDEADEELDSIRNQWDEMAPEQSDHAEASFEKEGALDIIEAIAQYLASGTMAVEAEVTLTQEYEWRGRTHAEEWTGTVDAIVAVGSLSYDW